jgi:hypothetical protein
VIGMRVKDYYPQGKRWWFRLHEKGGKRHDVPAHHAAASGPWPVVSAQWSASPLH